MSEPRADSPSSRPGSVRDVAENPFAHKIRDALLALSIANLCFISAWAPLLYSGSQGYYNKLRVAPVTLLALVANLAWLSLAVWVILRASRRSHSRWLALLSLFVFLASLALPLDYCRLYVVGIRGDHIVAALKKPLVASLVVAVCGIGLWQYRLAVLVSQFLATILSPLALLNLARVAFLCLGIQHLSPAGPDPVLPAPCPVKAGAPRVAWIIFDEADQRIAFEERPAQLRLPEFDRLSRESLFATNAFPPAGSTLVSMPALISGRPISAAALKDSCELNVTLAESGTVTGWSKLPSVFSAAHELGVNTALVGWYHPYNRILGSALNFCSFYPFPRYDLARAPTFGKAMAGQVLCCLYKRYYYQSRFETLCRDSLADSVSLVTNNLYGLLLLHLAPPHHPGVYNPKTGQYTIAFMNVATGYFNNFALADRFLGTLRQAMETSGQSTNTWLLVSADHFWRETDLYDHRHSFRVPFLLKGPGADQPMTYSPRFNTLLTHDLILAILRKEITNQPSASEWLDAHRSAFSVPTTYVHQVE